MVNLNYENPGKSSLGSRIIEYCNENFVKPTQNSIFYDPTEINPTIDSKFAGYAFKTRKNPEITDVKKGTGIRPYKAVLTFGLSLFMALYLTSCINIQDHQLTQSKILSPEKDQVLEASTSYSDIGYAKNIEFIIEKSEIKKVTEDKGLFPENQEVAHVLYDMIVSSKNDSNTLPEKENKIYIEQIEDTNFNDPLELLTIEMLLPVDEYNALVNSSIVRVGDEEVEKCLPEIDINQYDPNSVNSELINFEIVKKEEEIPPITDTDGDGVLDNVDNCPNTYNPDQSDWDNDGIGTVCDSEEMPGPAFGKDKNNEEMHLMMDGTYF